MADSNDTGKMAQLEVRLRKNWYVAVALAAALGISGAWGARTLSSARSAISQLKAETSDLESRLISMDKERSVRTSEVIRLLDLDAEAVEWPLPAEVESPEEIRPARVGSEATVGRVGRVLMFGPGLKKKGRKRPPTPESRLALLAPTGSDYRYRLLLPDEPVLHFGIGYVPPPSDTGLSIGFEVAVVSDAVETIVFEQELVASHDGEWIDIEVSLLQWAGDEVSLSLRTAGDAELGPIWAAWAAPEILRSGARQPGWNVLLISLDTLRADRLGAYGYERATSPSIDKLAARSVRFETVVSPAPWTRPSHQAMLTGIYPISNQGLESIPLARQLWNVGYQTRAITGGGWLHFDHGFDEGFEEYRIEHWVKSLSEVLDQPLFAPGRRQFLFLHTYEIHGPLTHDELAKGMPSGRVELGVGGKALSRLQNERPLNDEERRYVGALYDSGIRYTDARLGQLVERLEASGMMEHTVVVVTSDHGEQLGDHGSYGHGKSLYDHQLLVPLILYLPPGLRQQLGLDEGVVIDDQVRLVDLYPTLLDLLGVPLAHPVQGRTLRPLLEGSDAQEADAFSEDTSSDPEQKALRSQGFKFVSWETGKNELYDLRQDPGEQNNLAAERTEMVETLEARLEQITANGGTKKDIEAGLGKMQRELRAELEALGYLGD